MKKTAAAVILPVIMFFLIASSLILIGASLLPFDFVKTRLNSLTADGKSDIFDIVLHNRIVKLFRYIGAFFFLAATLLHIYRHKVRKLAFDISASAAIFLKGMKRHLAAAAKEENGLYMFFLAAIFISGGLIRLLYISRPMHMDECFTFTNCASRPFYMCLSQYVANNHVFHTLLVRISYLIFGNHAWALRLPAFIGGVLLIPVSYLTARVLYNRYAAILSAVFISFSTVLISFSVNARGYTMWCLFFLLILALGAYLKKNVNLFAWTLFAVLSAIGFYIQPLMAYPFGATALWLFISIIVENKDRALKYRLMKRLISFSALAVILTILLYLPIIVVSGINSITANSRMVLNIFLHKDSILLAWQDWNCGVPLIARLLLITGFFVSLFFHHRIANHRVPIVLPVMMWIPIPLMLITRPHDYSRYWLFLFPVYIMTASAGISLVLKPVFRNKIAFAALIVGLSLYLSLNIIKTNSVYYFCDPREKLFYDAEDVAVFFKEKNLARAGDCVLSYSPTILEYHFFKYHIPSLYFKNHFSTSNRIFAVMQQGYPSKDILKGYGMDSAKYAYPKEIRRFKYSILYEIARKGD